MQTPSNQPLATQGDNPKSSLKATTGSLGNPGPNPNNPSNEPSSPSNLKILDLFSGIGGFTLGLHAANHKDGYDFTKFPSEQPTTSDGYFETIAFCEIDPAATAVLNKRYPSIPVLPDVCLIDQSTIDQLGGRIDILTGGFPCQDLSCAGKQAGLQGSRSGLFYEMMRIASIAKPSYIIFENVKELITNADYHQAFRNEITARGYDYTPFLLRAETFGLQHQRKRAFCIAYPHQKRHEKCHEVFFKHANEVQRKPPECLVELRRAINAKKGANDYTTNGTDIRSDDGFSRDVVRFGLCGNSLIPQIPYVFGRLIRELEGSL